MVTAKVLNKLEKKGSHFVETNCFPITSKNCHCLFNFTRRFDSEKSAFQLRKTYNGKKGRCPGAIMPKLFAFVHIFVESMQMDEVVAALQRIPNIEELFHVTGEFDVVSLVSANDIEQFRDVLKNQIMKISGVRSTVSSVVLHRHNLAESPPLTALVSA